MKIIDMLLGKKGIPTETIPSEYPAIMQDYFKEISDITGVQINKTSDILSYLEGTADEKIKKSIMIFNEYYNLSHKLSEAEIDNVYVHTKTKYERLKSISADTSDAILNKMIPDTEGQKERLSELNERIEKYLKQITEYETKKIDPLKNKLSDTKPEVINMMNYIEMMENIKKSTAMVYYDVRRADLKKVDMTRLPKEINLISSKLNTYQETYLKTKIRVERVMKLEELKKEATTT